MSFNLRKHFLAIALTVIPATAFPAWVLVASEQGKRVEIERDSIVANPNGGLLVKGRVVLDKPIVDSRTSAEYRIIEVQNRFDCNERTYATLKRSYYKSEGDLLRQEEVRSPFDMPVRSGTPDDRMLREVCRPKGASAASSVASASKTVERVSEVSGDLRKVNEALVEKAVKKDLNRIAPAASPVRPQRTRHAAGDGAPSAPVLPANLSWSYEGMGGPENWSRIRPENAVCASGRLQSPIDLRDGIAVDLETIEFDYRPAAFRVVDAGRNLQIAVYGGRFSLLGKGYELIRVNFHRPAEFTVAGRAFAMDVQLVHKADDGKLAIVSVFLEPGTENAFVQTALNNLPLEKGGEVSPPGRMIDLSSLVPEQKAYFTFMGSLTVPPCTEDVLWLIMKQPQQLSPAQLSIFQRLYPPNARPLQPAWGRIIKESR